MTRTTRDITPISILSDTGESVYERCAIRSNGEISLMIQCVSDHFESAVNKEEEDIRQWLMILSGALIFFMQTGFAMLCAGWVRKKNLRNTMLKNLLDAAGAAVAFFAVGYALAFGKPYGSGEGKSWIGVTHFMGRGDLDLSYWFFKYAFSATSVTIVAGTLAERCKMAAYLSYSLFLVGIVYPISARALWSKHGFLSPMANEPFGQIGSIDLAGAGVIHCTGGITALIAASILGSRQGRFYDRRGVPLETPRSFPGHSKALQLIGTMILWFGWYGFNAGSALLLKVENTGSIAALAAVNTSLAAAGGAISALFSNLYIRERQTGDVDFSLGMAMNGALIGLVSSTSGCLVFEPWATCLIGIIAGWLYMAASALLVRFRIDDAVDAIPVHLAGGVWGMIATGLLAAPERMKEAFGSDQYVGLLYGIGRGTFDCQLLGNNTIALVLVLGWPLCTMTPFFFWLRYMGWLRADSIEERIGLDMSYHCSDTRLGVDANDDNWDLDSEERRLLEEYTLRNVTISQSRRNNGRSIQSSAVATDEESTPQDARSLCDST